MASESETELDRDFARLAAGDRTALDPVFRALWPVVRKFCQRCLDSRADADDVAQRAIEKLFLQAADYDPSRSAVAWALTVAFWECRSARRSSERRRLSSLEVELASADASPEQALTHAELHVALASAIEHLSTADQDVLKSVLAEDNGGGAVGGAAFRKRKERAIARLREMWRRLYGI